MKKLAFLVSIIALLILTTISCLEGNPTITDIMADPEKWEGKEVTVEGQTTQSKWEIDFVLMDDKATQILVQRSEICQAPAGKPTTGKKVKATGIVWIIPKGGFVPTDFPYILANS